MVSCKKCLHSKMCRIVKEHGMIDKLMCSQYLPIDTNETLNPDYSDHIPTFGLREYCFFPIEKDLGGHKEKVRESTRFAILSDKDDLHWVELCSAHERIETLCLRVKVLEHRAQHRIQTLADIYKKIESLEQELQTKG